MTDATLNQILQMRSPGRRIPNVQSIFQNGQGRRPLRGQLASPAAINQLTARAVVSTTQVELTITSRVGPQAPPTKLVAIVANPNNNRQAVVQSKQW
jgi:hypothetical protein